MKVNPAIIAYLPPSHFQCTVPAFKNFTSFKTKYPMVFYSESEEWEGAVRLKADPANVTRNAFYPNGKPNAWSVNNMVFWTGMRIARDRGFSHVLYLEVDCRVNGDEWDGKVFDEFFTAGPGKIIGGTTLCYSPCNRDLAFTRAWMNFVCAHKDHPFPVCAYGGGGSAEKFDQVVMVNGALGVYELEWISQRFDLNNTVELARKTTAWDFAIGRELAKHFGPQVFDKVVHLKSVYSLYKDSIMNEEQRIELLTTGKVVAVHQVKSNWTILGSVAEKVDASRSTATEEIGAPQSPVDQSNVLAKGNAGSSPAAATIYGDDPDGLWVVKEEPKMAIFIVTHAKDFGWLNYCLQSVKRFAARFDEVVIAVPKDDYRHFVFSDDSIARVVTFNQAPPPLGHLHHEIIKTRADEYCLSDYILHVDADCIFTESVTPAMFLEGDKPIVLYKTWAKIEEEKQTSICWREPTNQVLGFQTTCETMQRLPLVYRRGLYSFMRKHVEAIHGRPFNDFILSRHPTFPYGYCEFGSLGSFALHKCPELYHWLDAGVNPHPHNPLRQFWSHGPMDKPQKLWHEGQMTEIVPMEEIKRVLNL